MKHSFPSLTRVTARLAAAPILVALLLAGAAAHAQFGPAQRISLGAGSQPFDVELADINGDGKPDAVTGNSRTGTVGVLLNTTATGAAAPGFGAVAAFPTGAGSTPYEVETADFNGDGKPDVAAASDGTREVVLLLNTTAAGAAAPSFAPPAATSLPGAGQYLELVAGDVNGDGKPDLVISSASQTATGIPDELGILLNTTAAGAATASFAPLSIIAVPGTFPADLTLTDLNGDNKLDLAVSNSLLGTVSTYLNTTAAGAASPSFVPAASVHLAGVGQYIGLTAGDVNGDGKPDLATTARTSGGMRVLLNTTAAGAATVSFAAAATFGTGTNSNPLKIKLADVNGDGRPDALVANFYDSTIGVLLNTTTAGAATASFADSQSFAADPSFYYTLHSLAVADLDGDGRLDVVGVSARANLIGVLRNTTVKGAATASFAAVATFSTGPGAFPVGVAVADLNGDGRQEVLSASAGLDAVGILPNTTPAGTATPSFAPVLNLSAGAGNSPEVVAVGDVNGDGRPDVVSANLASATVWLNTTAAGAAALSFAPVAFFALAANNNPYSLALADVNGDTRPDLVVLSLGTEEVAVLLNTTAAGAATASFAARATFSTGSGSQPDALAVGDVNGDGKPDLAVTNSGTSAVALLLNTTPAGAATPSFAALAIYPTGTTDYLSGIALADLNGDGKQDLVFTNYDESAADIMLNTTPAGATAASFAPAAEFTTGSLSYPNSVAVGDVDGNGRPDLVVALSGSQAVVVLPNTTGTGAADPSFGDPAIYETGAATSPYNLALGDVNGDHKLDAVVASFDSDEVLVLPNQSVLATHAAVAAAGALAYPNPTTGRLTVRRPATAAASAQLYNALGQLVRTLALPTPETNLELDGLPAGVYVLRLLVGGQPVALRLARQ